MEAVTQGVRILHLALPSNLRAGDYGKLANGTWYCRPPGFDGIGNLANHEVTEHSDGTITVAPSILLEGGEAGRWHGYLEHGVWREV